jgi:hypothetical protein
MASTVRIEHTYEVSEDTFWNEFFLDEEYNRRLYLEALKFHAYAVSKQDESGDEVRRTLEVTPKLGDLPGPMKKVLGDNMSYREEGVYDRGKRRYRVNIVPASLAGKIKVTGEMYTEPLGEKQCRRVFEANVEVKVLGLGKMMEKRIITDLEKSYAVGARFTNEYAKEKSS